MKRTYYTPQGQTYNLYLDMLAQPHLLIAGATGSGKSVIINALIYSALYDFPNQKQFILIDPKRVELIDYKNLPHTVLYASEHETMRKALNAAMDITENRYKQMQKEHSKKYQNGDLYIIIDELADLMTTDKRHIQPLLQRLAQVGRAAKVHIIAATQCPLATVIPTAIKVNFDARIALRTRSAQDSRNILGIKCCEDLPRFGYGYYMKPEETKLYEIPMIPESELQRLITHWEKQTPHKFKF